MTSPRPRGTAICNFYGRARALAHAARARGAGERERGARVARRVPRMEPLPADGTSPGVVGWDDLPVEVLQVVCAHLDWRSLCNLEAVGCRLLSFPTDSETDLREGDDKSDGEQLGMIEHAAKRMAFADPLLRPSARRPDESWKFVCAMLEVGVYRRGVLGRAAAKSVALSRQALSTHWTLAYEAQYDHRTQDEDLERVPEDARDVLVAAMPRVDKGQPSELYLAAWGPRDVVLRETHGQHEFRGHQTTTSNEHEGVFFYRWPGSSFGFSEDPSLHLWKADAGAIIAHCLSRLSSRKEACSPFRRVFVLVPVSSVLALG